MGVQAGAVRRRLEPEQQVLRETLMSVEETGRTAIEELRHVLGVLRGGIDAPKAPEPTLTDVDGLVAAARAAGQQVTLRVHGVPPARSGGVEVSGYRIAQELLTNARKHAPGQDVELTIDYAVDAVTIRATNGIGAAAPPPRGHGAGHGLLGMRERVAAFGGTLEVDPSRGAFTVVVVLPVRASVEVA
jgi:signal transduction histidine kinase